MKIGITCYPIYGSKATSKPYPPPPSLHVSTEARLQTMARAGRKTAQDHSCTSKIVPLYEEHYK